jgi:glycosyltransferase involved in cell wall biosynthesis
MLYLSVIIPAYNEESRLPETLEAVRVYLEGKAFKSEIIVVDDASKDNTVGVVEAMQPGFGSVPLRLIRNEVNKGKGGVVKQGILAAKGEIRLFADADNSTPIVQLDILLPFIEQFPVVIGSRYLQAGSIKNPQPLKRRILSRGGNAVIQLFVLPGIKDTQCGFKLFQAEAAEKIFSALETTSWAFDVEVLALARHFRYSIKEVAVDWYDANDSKLRAVKAATRSLKDVWRVYRRMHNM